MGAVGAKLVYHFTYHAYRSWRPDHPRGYFKKGAGVQEPDPEMAARYDRAATQVNVTFDDSVQREILALSAEICKDEGWVLEGAGFDPSHVHAVVSWAAPLPWEEVDRRLKNLLVLKLNRRYGTPGKRWFVRRHGVQRRVKGKEHLDYLLNVYFPDHPGIFWRKGMELPRL